MAWTWINPRWREALHRQGLVEAEDFLRLPGVILCGHPDRHVLKIESPIQGYLKKEHRVPLRDRLANAWAGFGFVSKSTREAEILQRAGQGGLPCPEVLAHGAKGRQAFLLVQEQAGMVEIRNYIAQHPDQEHALARELGRESARLHAAGFQHDELYSKHVLVGPGPRSCFLDWQRARKWKTMPVAVRQRELATLDATLPESLASDSARLACLRAYLGKTSKQTWKTWADAIRRLSLKLQQKHRVRNLRRVPLESGVQNLIWLDGEALCVTRTFREELGERVPDWLRFRQTPESGVERTQVSLHGGRKGTLVRRSVRSIARRVFSWWHRQPAPEVKQAVTIFHLERHRVICPKLLAFGHDAAGLRQNSLLLTEAPAIDMNFAEALRKFTSGAERHICLRRAGEFIRKIHDSGHVLDRQAADAAGIGISRADKVLALTRIDGLERKPKNWPDLAVLELPKMSWLGELSRADKMRFIHGYLRIARLNREGRVLVRRILARFPRKAAR